MKLAVASLIPLLIVGGPQTARAADHEIYRGFYINTTEIAGTKALDDLEPILHHQLDIVASAGLSARTMTFLRNIPIVMNQWACMENTPVAADAGPPIKYACYGQTASRHAWEHKPVLAVWNSQTMKWEGVGPDHEEYSGETGTLMSARTGLDPVRTAEAYGFGVVEISHNVGMWPDEPILLHEMLHAFHHNVLPGGYDNETVKHYYSQAKTAGYQPGLYHLTNQMEFFAVTGSVFLYGRGNDITREELCGRQKDYCMWLAVLFGVTPTNRKPLTEYMSEGYREHLNGGTGG
jgi:hypothetical protein